MTKRELLEFLRPFRDEIQLILTTDNGATLIENADYWLSPGGTGFVRLQSTRILTVADCVKQRHIMEKTDAPEDADSPYLCWEGETEYEEHPEIQAKYDDGSEEWYKIIP